MAWRYGWYYDSTEHYYYGAEVTGFLIGSYEYGSYGWDNVFSFTGTYSWGTGWHLDYGWEYSYFTGNGYFELDITGYFADGWNSTYGTFSEDGRGTVSFDNYSSYSAWEYDYYYDFDSWFSGVFETNYDDYIFTYTGDISVVEYGWFLGWYWDSWSYDWWYYDWWYYDWGWFDWGWFGWWWYGWWYGWDYGWYYAGGGWHYGWHYGW